MIKCKNNCRVEFWTWHVNNTLENGANQMVERQVCKNHDLTTSDSFKMQTGTSIFVLTERLPDYHVLFVNCRMFVHLNDAFLKDEEEKKDENFMEYEGNIACIWGV